LVVPDGMILGHEFTGEIVDIGAEVGPGWTLGERVTAWQANEGRRN
jgi:D-arabinose 1-dehydrogenase-like Zn-dependent alcohol dehydrogenase